jgi:spore coat polysaccharide biosynthesis predicted glycosyltransferase SpsG
MLITMGGSDSPNITLLAMRALPLIKSLRLEVRIIVGTANLNLPALHEELPRLQIAHEAEILVNPPDMPGQMAWSDVTLTAAGSSCWELCCLGVPQLVLETANVQRMMSPYFVEHDIAEVMGVINEERLGELAARLERLLADAPKRARLSQASMGIIDGQGAMRVVDFMLGRA